MIRIKSIDTLDYDKIKIDEEWNECDRDELIMHTLHAYPAKFPAFIAQKAFEYAEKEGVQIKNVSDIFCGCGTVAVEARIRGYNFWGCDINPVATLIAKTKSNTYEYNKVEKYYNQVVKYIEGIELPPDLYSRANDRLKYWFYENTYCTLYKLHQAITTIIQEDKYREAFECNFSAILKSCSKWLTKSIKPQIDSNKKEIDVMAQFKRQINKFLRSLTEMECNDTKTEIKCTNFLTETDIDKVNLIITSPPYVTSYEYADLHQLSSLWLGYTNDYRELRKGTIGSIYNSDDFILDKENLNDTGRQVVDALENGGMPLSKVKSVARYYIDMQTTIKKCHGMLDEKGMVFFVVGDTEYKGVKILNSQHLIEAMFENGFRDIKIGKRTISKRICIPYRDEKGKFSKDKNKRKVYHEEFIISGRR